MTFVNNNSEKKKRTNHLKTIKLTTEYQKILCHIQGAVVWCWFNLQQFTHQRINVDAVKRLSCEILFEVGSKSPENSLHVHLFIVVAMITFVDINDESLMGTDEVEELYSSQGLFYTDIFVTVLMFK